MTPDGDGMDALGGALGFVQIGGDPAEIADGTAAVAAACGRCHAERAIATLAPRPAFAHATAARWAAWGLVWSEPAEPSSSDDAPAVALMAAWRAVDPADTDTPANQQAFTRVLGACAGCHHGKSPALGSPGGG